MGLLPTLNEEFASKESFVWRGLRCSVVPSEELLMDGSPSKFLHANTQN